MAGSSACIGYARSECVRMPLEPRPVGQSQRARHAMPRNRNGGTHEEVLCRSQRAFGSEYVEARQADGVPVIFLHGVTDSWRSFERVLPLLPPNIHAFALSQRGHGDSSRPTSGYRFADMSADLLAFMDAMGLRTAIIVGHSMGASVAQRFVIDHPDRVARLVLMGAFSTYRGSRIGRLRGIVDRATDRSDRPPFAREWQLSTLARAMPADHLDAVVSETLKVPARVWREAFDGFLKTPDFTSELTKVSVPVLLMWGDRDSYALRAAQDRLLEVMPKARFIAYQGFGHAFHWEDPEQFTKDLVPFLTSRTGRDSLGAAGRLLRDQRWDPA